MPNTNPIITFSPFIAHRGAHRFLPENTIEAFQKAKALGATWIECDIQLTRDHVPVIFHDFTGERLTSYSGKIIDINYHALAKLPLDFPQGKLSGQSCFIPTFEQALHCFSSLNLHSHLEIKTQPSHAEITAEIFTHTLKKFPYFNPSNTIISSSNLDALAAAYHRLPEFKYGWVVDNILSQDNLMHLPLSLFSLHINYKHLSEKLVKDLIAQGYHVLSYTVNDPEIASQLFDWGVSSVFTDTLYY